MTSRGGCSASEYNHFDSVQRYGFHHAVVVLYRQGFEAKAQALEASHIQASGMVDRSKISIEAKQRAEDDIRRDVEIAKLGAENALVERVRACLLSNCCHAICTCRLGHSFWAFSFWVTPLRQLHCIAYFAWPLSQLPRRHSFSGPTCFYQA